MFVFFWTGEDVAKLERQVRNQSELDQIIQQLNATIGNRRDLSMALDAFLSELKGDNQTLPQQDVEGCDGNKTIEEWRRFGGQMKVILNHLNKTIGNTSTLDEVLTTLNVSLDELNKSLIDVNKSIDQRNQVKDLRSQNVADRKLQINNRNREIEDTRQTLIDLNKEIEENDQLLEEKTKQIVKLNQDYEVASGPCSSAGCFSTAVDVTLSMDTDVDPCNDFYRFACGGFPRNYPVPEGLEMWNAFQELDKDTRNLIKG